MSRLRKVLMEVEQWQGKYKTYAMGVCRIVDTKEEAKEIVCNAIDKL